LSVCEPCRSPPIATVRGAAIENRVHLLGSPGTFGVMEAVPE
jgi:hypothetical protein